MNDDLTLEEKFEKFSEELTLAVAKRLRKFFAKALFAFAVLGLTSALALLGFGLVLDQQSDTSRNIQTQRYNTLYDICVDQNNRHDTAVSRAKTILPVRAHDTVEKLIDALLPRVDNCAVQAESRVKGTDK